MLSDKENNPSRYAFVIAAEGATWQGRDQTREVARDADGRRHHPDIGLALATELRRLTGQDTMHSDLSYDLRSGNPDALDQTVATTFATSPSTSSLTASPAAWSPSAAAATRTPSCPSAMPASLASLNHR